MDIFYYIFDWFSSKPLGFSSMVSVIAFVISILTFVLQIQNLNRQIRWKIYDKMLTDCINSLDKNREYLIELLNNNFIDSEEKISLYKIFINKKNVDSKEIKISYIIEKINIYSEDIDLLEENMKEDFISHQRVLNYHRIFLKDLYGTLENLPLGDEDKKNIEIAQRFSKERRMVSKNGKNCMLKNP